MPAILQLALLIAILLPASKIVASLCSRFGIPPIIGELMVGIVAGPGALNLLHLRIFNSSLWIILDHSRRTSSISIEIH